MNFKQLGSKRFWRLVLSMTLSALMVFSSLPTNGFAAVLGTGQVAAAGTEQRADAGGRAADTDSTQTVPGSAGASRDDGASFGSAVDEGAPVLDARNLDDAKLVDAPQISTGELKALGADDARAPRSSRAAGITEGDGNKIERISTEWITKNSDGSDAGSRLSLKPATDDTFNVRMRVNAAFSGQHDYEPGQLKITVPKTMFQNRDGSVAGTMTLSVPEAPDSRGTFAYADLGDYYVLTNTRKLSAATSVMFEFSFRDLTPHELVGNPDKYVSSKFAASAQVTTHKGNMLTLDSQAIDAVIDTSEKVTKADASIVTLTEAWDDSWPAQLKPQNDGSYVYADYYTWATVNGNQAFKLAVEHDASATGHGVKVLGIQDQYGTVTKTDSNGKGTATLSESTYAESDSRNFYTHVYIAVPKSQVPDNGKYVFKDQVTYTLTSLDDNQVTKQSASAQKTYAPLAFVNPHGHFNVFKDGSVPHREDDRMRSWGDPESLALNDLRDGKAIEATYQVETFGFPAPWTWQDANGDGKMTEDELEKKSVKMQTDDYSVQFDNQGKDLTSSDFEFASINITKPEVYHYEKFKQNAYGVTDIISGYISYQKIPAGEFGYMPVDDPARIPDVTVWGQTDGGRWTQYATVSWKTGSAVAQPINGASWDADTQRVVFPSNVTDVRTQTDSTASGVWYYAYPTVRLKATDAVRARVEQLYKNSTSPSTTLRNTTVMKAYDSTGKEIITCGPKSADDKLSGASLGVKAEKTLKVENDIDNRLARLTYTVKVHEQSNLTNIDDYNEAIGRGIFGKETSGTFYDLLPKGVVPDKSSVRLRSGDKVQSVRAIENYKGSGRTLLVVKAALTPNVRYTKDKDSITGESGYEDVPELSFKAIYTWEDISDQGDDLNNVVAFESGNASLGNMQDLSGEPDNPLAGRNETSKKAVRGVEELMTNLDAGRDDPSFVYANCDQKAAVDTNAITSLSKSVSVNHDGIYGDGLGKYALNVYEGGSYTYRLRMQNDDKTQARDLVIYDSLENYKPTSDKTEDVDDKQWRGTLQSVDVSQLTAKGIDAKVYYSTKKGIKLDDTDDRSDMDLTDSKIWSTEKPSDPSTITAIAVDARHAKGGGDFVLDAGEAVTAFVNMRAPHVSDNALAGSSVSAADKAKWYDTDLESGQTESGDGGLAGGAHAYNNVSMLATTISTETGAESERQLVRYDYTKVGLRSASIKVVKKWDDANDQDGKRAKSVTVHLIANGEDTHQSAVLSEQNDWSHTFEGVDVVDENGSPIDYTFSEDDVAGYTSGVVRADGPTPAEADVYTVTNTHETEKVTVSGTKTWDDSNDAAGKRPSSIKLTLYRNGEKTDRTVTVKPDASGNWTYQFTGLDKYYDHGKIVNYTVKEDAYYAGYVPSTGKDGVSVTNTYHPYGNLEISKAVEQVTDASRDKVFTFRITIDNEDGTPNSGAYTYTTSDNRTGTVRTGGIITLQGGQTATVKDIPSESTYKVTEDGVPGFTQTGKVGDTGSIKAGQTAEAAFTNTYDATGLVRLQAKKTLDGRQMKAGQFSFDVLDDKGNVLRTSTNDGEGNIVFGAIRYGLSDVNKTYTYTIREKDDGKGGYTYDGHDEKVSVTVTDNGDGTLTATPTYDEDGASFHNTYAAKGSLTLRAWKTLDYRDLKEGEFTFELKDSTGKQIDTAKNSANGTVEFKPLEFTEKDAGKDLTYTVDEVAGTDSTVIYSKQSYTYRVHVSDNGDGTLSFTQTTVDTKGDDATPVIENKLEPGSLRLEKHIQGEGNGDADQEFTFHVKLTGKEGQTLPTGSIKFDREKLDDWGASSTSTQNADATDKADGQGDDAHTESQGEDGLEGITSKSGDVSPSSYPKTGATKLADLKTNSGFKGTYWSDGTLEVSGTSKFNAESDVNVVWSLSSSTSGLTLSGVKAEVTTVKFDAGSKAVGSLTGLFQYFESLENVVGTLDMQGVTSANRLFNNCSNLKNLNVSGWDLSNAVTLQKMFNKCSSLVNLPDGGWNLRKAQDVSSMFTDCSSLTSESVSKITLSDTVTDVNDIFDSCTSLTSPLDLSGWDLSNVTNTSYMFAVCTGLTSAPQLNWSSLSNVTDTSYMFYGCQNIKELDLSSWTVASVEDMRGMFFKCGHLTSLNLAGWDCSNVTTMEDLFSETSIRSITLGTGWRFVGTDAQLPSPSSSGYTGKWVNQNKPQYTYTSQDLMKNYDGDTMAGTWVWEKKPTEYTVHFDNNAADATGALADQTWNIGTHGKIPTQTPRRFNYRFTEWNTKADGTGWPYTAGQKLFRDLYGAKAGGTVTLYAQWEELDNSVTVNNGEFDITIHGDEAAIIKNLPAGIGYTVTEKTPAGWVQVESGTTGQAGAIPANGTATATFTNEYTPGKVQASLAASKLLDGAPARAGYTFTLSDGDGNVLQTVQNADGGGVTFKPITYNKAGEYTYTIREQAGGDKNITYDSHTETVTVTVKDDGGGNLTASAAYDDDGAVFKNTTKEEAKGKLTVKKAVEGTDDKDTEFHFRVDYDGGRTSQTFDLKAGGSWTSEALEPGTAYQVTELDLPDGYTQKSIENASGTIQAGTTAGANVVTVTNSYKASGSAVIQAKKVLKDGTLQGGEFTFQLKDTNGNELQTATNAADGTVAFDAIDYTTPGDYTYTIDEVAHEGDQKYEYDTAEKTVTVHVTDSGNGSLATKVDYNGDSDGEGEAPTFTNRMKPAELKISKTVTGATQAVKDKNRDFFFTLQLWNADNEPLDGEYSFTLEGTGVTDETKPGTVKLKDGEGALALKDGQTATVEVPQGCRYRVTENDSNGFTSTSTGEQGTVDAGKDAPVAAFTNAYDAAGTFKPVVKKILEGDGAKLEAGQFSFQLIDGDGRVVQTVTNAADGSVTFDALSYTAADDGKTFTYRIDEVDDGQQDIAYDSKVVELTVKVADKGDGTMAVTATYDGTAAASGQAGATFTNTLQMSVSMPATGRGGIAAGVAAGAALIVLSATYLLGRRRRG